MSNEFIPAINRLRLQLSHNISRFLQAHSFKGSTKLRNLMVSLLAPRPRGSTIIHTYYGFDIFVDPVADKGLEREIYYYGTYEAGTLYVMRRCLREGDTFIDVGANIGFISLAAAKIVDKNGTVYAIEAHPHTYKILEKNINLNSFKNVYSINTALGSKVSEARIYDNYNSRGSFSLIPSKNVPEKSGMPVKVTTIDTLIESNQIKLPNLIKIDVEGFELEVLKGAKILLSSLQAPALCVEFSELHPTYGGNVYAIYNFIKSTNDYFFFKLKYGKERPSKLIRISSEKELPYHDNVFCFLNKHLQNIE